MTTLDFTALGDPHPAARIVTFHPPVKRRLLSGRGIVVVAVAVWTGGLVLLLMLADVTLHTMERAGRGETSIGAPFIPLGLGLLLIAGVVVPASINRRRIRKHPAPPADPSVASLLPAFAAANGLTYTAVTSEPSYPGVVFGSVPAVDRCVTDHLQPSTGRRYDIGTYEFDRVNGNKRVPMAYGYIAVKLDQRMPNLLLASIANRQNTVSEIPPIDTHQTLQLEGDFNEYFTLYCPKGYETDALYFFAPDLMALLIAEVDDFDVEVVDDWLMVYSPRPFTNVGVRMWERLFRIVDVVGAKAAKQSAHYVDDTAAFPGYVSSAGARLRGNARALYALTFVGIVGWLAAMYGIWRLLTFFFPLD